MICRSAVIPTIIGLGAAAVVAAGGATAVAGAPGEATLNVTVQPSTTTPLADQTVTVTTSADVENGTPTELKISKVVLAAPDNAGSPKVTKGCDAEPVACILLTDGKLRVAETVISLENREIKDPVKLKVTITVTATVNDEPIEQSRDAIITFAKVSPGPTSPSPGTSSPGSGKPTQGTKKPTKPTKSSKPATSSSGGGSNSSGSGGSSGSSSSGSSGSGTTGGVIPPAPNSSFDPRNPQVALPPITSPNAPNPSVAPGQVATPESRLQGNKAPVAQDLTFERMASTQIAWLAALMVAFSLLLTQARLGRKRMSAAAPKRTKGEHRRPRRGSFGK
ncbi:hypothetical protein [Actinomadura sp. 3N508]|uniref:hypothetical protein n=1 Tax=Actinomadura sp. 3N508 TaxID=3375153 RepID=UPI0037937F0C